MIQWHPVTSRCDRCNLLARLCDLAYRREALRRLAERYGTDADTLNACSRSMPVLRRDILDEIADLRRIDHARILMGDHA